jgi:hypothetical protein
MTTSRSWRRSSPWVQTMLWTVVMVGAVISGFLR